MRHTILSLLLALTALTASEQCRYCNTYEEFLEGRWERQTLPASMGMAASTTCRAASLCRLPKRVSTSRTARSLW